MHEEVTVDQEGQAGGSGGMGVCCGFLVLPTGW